MSNRFSPLSLEGRMVREDCLDTPHCPDCKGPTVYAGTIRRALAPTMHLFRCTVCGATVREPGADRPKP